IDWSWDALTPGSLQRQASFERLCAFIWMPCNCRVVRFSPLQCAVMRHLTLLYVCAYIVDDVENMMSNATRKTAADLRSARWFAPDDLRSFGHRSRMMQLGYSEDDFMGRPVIGILNTWSDLNSCHSHFPERVEAVKRGVTQAGGFAVELPT